MSGTSNPFDSATILDLRVPTMLGAKEFVGMIPGLKSQTNGVSVSVGGGLNRPPDEKTRASAAFLEHARSLAAEIGCGLADTHTGGGSDGNSAAAETATPDGLGVDGRGARTHYKQLYVSSIEPCARLLHGLYQTPR